MAVHDDERPASWAHELVSVHRNQVPASRQTADDAAWFCMACAAYFFPRDDIVFKSQGRVAYPAAPFRVMAARAEMPVFNRVVPAADGGFAVIAEQCVVGFCHGKFMM